jgi:DNA-binding transcriptional regulator YhcF (GntR family)
MDPKEPDPARRGRRSLQATTGCGSAFRTINDDRQKTGLAFDSSIRGHVGAVVSPQRQALAEPSGQIREMLVDAILTGILAPGDAVPSSRELAKLLGVGRITVVMAYQQLTEEAFLLSRERKGHFIHPDVLQGRTTERTPATSGMRTPRRTRTGRAACGCAPACSAAS